MEQDLKSEAKALVDNSELRTPEAETADTKATDEKHSEDGAVNFDGHEVREGPALSRGTDELLDVKSSQEMKTPHMSKHYGEEKVLEKMGITPEIKRRSVALRKMGLTEEHLQKGEELMAQAPPATELNDKVEKITGYSHNQIRRSKAMAVLGTTEEMIDEERSRLVGVLGLEMQEPPVRQRSCAELLGVPLRRHTVSANSFRRRHASQDSPSKHLDEVLPYPRLLALYQRECQINAQLRKEVENLRWLLELRSEANLLRDSAADEEDLGDEEDVREYRDEDRPEVKDHP